MSEEVRQDALLAREVDQERYSDRWAISVEDAARRFPEVPAGQYSARVVGVELQPTGQLVTITVDNLTLAQVQSSGFSIGMSAHIPDATPEE